MAKGEVFHKGKLRVKLSIYDVAPLVMYLAGIPLPPNLDGQVKRELLKGKARKPVKLMSLREQVRYKVRVNRVRRELTSHFKRMRF